MTTIPDTSAPQDGAPGPDRSKLAVVLHRVIVGVIATVMGIEAVLLALQGQWLNTLVLIVFLSFILSPTQLGRIFRIYIPLDFQVLAVLFIFAALFLGEIRDFYTRMHWWDDLLHLTSGILLGILGFVLAFVLNEDDRIDIHLRPSFMAFFAFLFAFSAGGFWEIFEFAMDEMFGMQMQKPKFGDPSGLTDTMLDMVMNALGATIICVWSWWFMGHRNRSFVEAMVQRFLKWNPQLSRRAKSLRRKQ